MCTLASVTQPTHLPLPFLSSCGQRRVSPASSESAADDCIRARSGVPRVIGRLSSDHQSFSLIPRRHCSFIRWVSSLNQDSVRLSHGLRHSQEADVGPVGPAWLRNLSVLARVFLVASAVQEEEVAHGLKAPSSSSPPKEQFIRIHIRTQVNLFVLQSQCVLLTSLLLMNPLGERFTGLATNIAILAGSL